jgi:S-DNA-T family DNA segregation ATPase FtsK/SpoIIIE
MIVTLLKNEGMNSISLPEKIKGQYWIRDYSTSREQTPIISIEGVQNQWVLKSNKRIQIIGRERQPIKEIIVEPYNLYCLYRKEGEEYEYLFTEPVTEDRKQYDKYLIHYTQDISIGRAPNNSIVFHNIAVSSTHARLTKNGMNWIIFDENSTNGIYVNFARVNGKRELVPGDVVFIMGLKIVIGRGFLAINNPDKQVTLNKSVFYPLPNEPMKSVEDDEEPEIEYFYRSPRFKRDIKKATIKVDSPPGNQQKEEMPLMMAIGPSLTMGLASMTTALFAINNAIQTGRISAAIPSVVMSFSMLLGTVLWPILTKRYEKKRSIEREHKRQSKYREYLRQMSNRMEQEAVKQKEILTENYLTVQQCSDVISHVKRSLWERELGQNDYLKLRVGIGERNADINCQYQERRFMLEDDNLQNEMLDLCENPQKMEQVPIIVSLFENYISGVVGKREDTLAFAKGLLLQLVTYYSYDELKIVMLMDAEELQIFETVRWLPHIWDNEKTMRMLATNPAELKQVSSYMEQVIKLRSGMNDEVSQVTPYYIILAFDRKLANKAEMLKMLYRQKRNLNISVITFFDAIQNLPKECTTVMELDNNSGHIFNKKDITGERILFVPDIYMRNNMENINLQLANVQLDIQSAAYNLPKMITFMEMYQVGKIEHLNALSRWKENDPTVSLEVPVGVDTFGELFHLDLHEKYHGPHGLVAGMTGSGKSEFIMTYILSLALNFHPYEVAFVLIDYKGGGMAKAFERLPHTVGIITNLDGAAVNRSLVSIQSELKRRQEIFVSVGNQVGESNIDIYKYQRLYRDGVVTEPLQHLFIISDEFAELKTQQSEFMEQLISAARIGRSLGVHLILATQKPAGVVDDQIWSNSKFKVCLKVQDRADSMDMLKRPDAAELSDTGRFYLQVGYNELFDLGQSAWAGAPYYPSDHVLVEKDDSVEVLDNTGMLLKRAKPRRKGLVSNPQKQLDAITEYLRQTAENENIQVRPLWLEPIPAYIIIDDLEQKYGVNCEPYCLNPIVGEYDDPSRQRQQVLQVPISQDGNVIVYGASGMGKTTFITALFYSVTKHHSWKEVNFYILDFSSESLRVLAQAPHVGDVLVSGDDEKISNLFRMLSEEIEHRKHLFAPYGGDMKVYNTSAEEPVANLVVIVNNFAVFIEQYDQFEDDVIYLSREGTKYGVYFVLAAVNTNDIRYRILQNFNQQYVLQLNDESDYANVLGNVGGVYPSKYKGRGILKAGEVYEFQTAHIAAQETNTISYLREYCQYLVTCYGKGHPKRIPILPDVVDVHVLWDELRDLAHFPVGISKGSLECVHLDFMKNTISLISGLDMDQIYPSVLGMIQLLGCMEDVRMYIIDPNYRYRKFIDDVVYDYFTDDVEEQIVLMFQLLVARNNTYKEHNGMLPPEEEFDHVVYVLQDYSKIFDSLSADGKEKLRLLLEKNEPEYKVHIIMCEESGNMSLRSVESWFKKHCVQGNGIWIGDGITDQYVIKVANVTKQMRADVESGFGYVVRNGNAVLCKVITAKEAADE